MAVREASDRSPFQRPGPIGQLLLTLRRSGAGARPASIYRKRSRAWRDENRLVAVLSALVPGAYTLVVVFLWHPRESQLFMGFGLGATAALYVGFMEFGIPDRIYNWSRGADAERRTGRRLRRLQRRGWIVIHGLAGERGDRDHVVIAPNGVFLLETKSRTGRISIEDGAIVVTHPDEPDRDDRRPIAGLCKARARELRLRVKARTRYEPWVQPVVVLWGDFPAGQVESAEVTFIHGDQLADWLQAQNRQHVPEWVVTEMTRAITEEPAHASEAAAA